MLVSAVLTLGTLHSNCTLLVAALPFFFRSWYVRAATLLSISEATSKWFPSLLCLKSKSPLISTWLSKESALPGVFADFSGARGELPPPRYGCRRLLACHRCAESNFRFVAVAQTQCPSTSRRPSLKKSLSSSIMPCSRALFNVRNRASPTSDCM